MPSYLEFLEVIPEAVSCAGTITLDGAVLCDHRQGEYFVTEHGMNVFAERKAAPAEKPAKAKPKKAAPADPVDEDPVVADLSLPEGLE